MNSDKHIIIPAWSIRGWYWDEHLHKRFPKPSKKSLWCIIKITLKHLKMFFIV